MANANASATLNTAALANNNLDAVKELAQRAISLLEAAAEHATAEALAVQRRQAHVGAPPPDPIRARLLLDIGGQLLDAAFDVASIASLTPAPPRATMSVAAASTHSVDNAPDIWSERDGDARK
jgi:hypothetical protein